MKKLHGLVTGIALTSALFAAASAQDVAPESNDTVAVDNSVLLDPFTFETPETAGHHHGHGRGYEGGGYFGDGYAGYDGEREHAWGHDVVVVDCSGHRGFSSISEAVEHVAPFGEVRVLSGFAGAPCMETVLIDKPVRIVGDRRGVPVTVASPPGQSCLMVRTEATVVLRDIRFAGHAKNVPCIELEEGRLIVRDIDIDAHGSSWAIDLGHGGFLAGAHLHIATDGAGINANGSRFKLADLAIDMEQGSSAGLMLERTDGEIEGLRIHGGHIGLEASPGSDQLVLAGVDISNVDRGLRLRQSSTPGAINITGLNIRNAGLGVAIGPDARVTLSEGNITDTWWAAIAIFHGAPFIHEIRIARAEYGFWIAGGDENVELDGNRVEGTWHAPIHFEQPGPARIIHNVLECNARGHCLTGGDESQIVHADNTCIFQGTAGPCEETPDAAATPGAAAPPSGPASH